MRRSLLLNSVLVTAAAASALFLTVTRRSPEGLVSFQLDSREVRAAPGEIVAPRHDLSALKIFSMALVRIKDRYVDPSRIDPKKMLYQALDSVQFNIPEVLVEPDIDHNKLTVVVNDKREVFDTADVDAPWRLLDKLKKVFRFIDANMNAGADLAQVEYAAVNGMLSTLDPHSNLMDPEAARDMDVSTSGKFGGLGIVIRMIDKKLTVIKPMKDTPAWKGGIKPGDHIAKINSEPTDNLTSDEAVERMRGKPETPVTLWIERKGEANLIKIDLVRAVIRVASVEHKLLDKGVGLIKIKQFSSSTAQETQDAMTEMSAQGATSWIVDLRYNPGGLLEQAVETADLFVDSGALVTTVSGRRREVHDATTGGDIHSSVAVLVNSGSASAAEIVSGALKNLDRSIVIGTRTFGKGSVQELYDNDDGSKLKLTIAEYLTPGDRSIQNIGIVPDVALQREYVPEKNDSPTDFVRLLAPNKSYGEKDLDAHLVSTYAKDIDKPAYDLPFVVDRPAKKIAAVVPATDPKAVKPATPSPAAPAAPTSPATATAPVDELDPPDADEIVEDFETTFARDLLANNKDMQRPALIKAAKALVAKTHAEQDKKLAAALSVIGVDWSPPPANQSQAAALDVSLSTTSSTDVKAGDTVTLTATVKNTSSVPAWQSLVRIVADDPSFNEAELPIGKVAPGETKTFSTQLKLPKDADDRVDQLSVDVHEAKKATISAQPLTLHVTATPHAIFAYSYQLADLGNGDGLVQPGEKYKLDVNIRNIGTGTAAQTTSLLRNASGDGVLIDKSRFELGEIKPGESRSVEFPLASTSALTGPDMVIELIVYDSVLGNQTSEKLHFPIRPALQVNPTTATVEAKTTADIHAGAADDYAMVGTAAPHTRFASTGTVGPFTRLDLGNGRSGFIATSAVTKTKAAALPAFTPFWQSTPPVIALALHGLESAATDSTYTLNGTVSDEVKVEDLYVIVSNPNAKIEGRKVFYVSNRGNKDPKHLNFSTQIPLWSGTNQVAVIARENSGVRSVETLAIFREPTRTAAATATVPAAK